jgi:hypothetical protein
MDKTFIDIINRDLDRNLYIIITFITLATTILGGAFAAIIKYTKERVDEIAERFSHDAIKIEGIVHEVNENSQKQAIKLTEHSKDIEFRKETCDKNHPGGKQ